MIAVCCLLVVDCCVLSSVCCCWLFILACCSLFAICRLSFACYVVCWCLSVGCGFLLLDSCVQCVVCGSLSGATVILVCVLFVVRCLL